MSSQTLGVRIPLELLERVDSFAVEHEIRRSKAIVDLVEVGLDHATSSVQQKAVASSVIGAQNAKTGQRAQAWGVRTARAIATSLGAEKAEDQPLANEFWLDGKRVAIKCARPSTSQCGMTNTMRERVDYIICASQNTDTSFSLYKLTPEQWMEHAHDTPRHNRNFGKLTHVSRSTYRRIGEDLGEVEIDSP
jgi:hypothetical protein